MILFVIISAIPFIPVNVGAQETKAGAIPEKYSNPKESTFKIVICDGPENAGRLDEKGNVNLTKNADGDFKYKVAPDYIPCNFNGIMKQVQHLINLMMIFGVFAAIVGFAYMGFLYIKGGKGDLDTAKNIAPKIFWGFVIMLSAWFVVYQLLEWLTGSGSGATTLLGDPN